MILQNYLNILLRNILKVKLLIMKQFIIFYSINVFIVIIILLLMEIAQLVLVCAKIVNRVSALNVIQCILQLITFINKIVHYCKTKTLALVVMIILICVY